MSNFEADYAKQKALEKLYHNMALFGKICFPTAIRSSTPPFHHELYKALQNRGKRRVLAAAPRGTAKSTVFSLIFPMHQIAFKKSNEEVFIVIISESQTQSINFLSRIKYHLTHTKGFSDVFGDLGPNTASRWTNTDIILANNARIVAVGTGQRVRGFITGDTRPTAIIIDDFESELNAATSEARAKNRKWITEAVIPSLADGGRILMVGTVISEDCFLYWAKDSPTWTVLWTAITNDDGSPVWPERFPADRIKEIRQEYESVGNITGFYQEYMNIAQAPDDAPFKDKWLKLHHYDFERIEGQNCLVREIGEEKKVIPVDLYTGVDPASSLNPRADFFVIATIGKDNDDNVYIVDLFRAHLNPSEQPDKIIEIFKKFRPRKMKIETVAYQEALRQSVRKRMLEENLYIPGLEKGYKPRTRKSERLISMVPVFAKGRFFFRPQDDIAQAEFLSYPRGKHDDIMDAIWMALDNAKPCRLKSVGKQEKTNKKKKLLDWLTI
jgi:predicted phage terminase large subunit-like protein